MRWCILWVLILASMLSICVHGQRTVTVSSSNNPAKESTQNILTCSFTKQSGDFITQLTWSKDEVSRIAAYTNGDGDVNYNSTYGNSGDYIMSIPDLGALQGSSTLTISSVSLDDIGLFQCEIRTLGPTTRNGVMLDVYVSPTSAELSTSSVNFGSGDLAEVIAGISYTFLCKTIGVRPEPIFEWKGRTADSQTNIPNSDNRLFDSTSTFSLVPEFGDNKDSLECSTYVAVDMASKATTHVVFDVKDPPENVVVMKSVEGPLLEGSDMTMTCTSGGNPAPNQYFWIKDGNVIENENTQQLVLGNIVTESVGSYQCEARNGYGSNERSAQVDVIVHYSPIIDKETDVKIVNPGDSITFECNATGLPTPVMTWIHHDGNIITNATDKMTITDQIIFQDGVHGTVIVSKLLIEDIIPDSDYGTYICEARNSIGQNPDVLRIDLNGTTVPEPVEDLTVISTSLDSIAVSWTPGYSGGESLEQSFVVVYRLYTENVPEEWSSDNQVPNGDNRYTVVDLLSGSIYDIRVISENELGRNENGPIVQGKTEGEPLIPTTGINIGGIIGGVIGSIVAIVILVVLVLFMRKKYLRDYWKGQTTRTDKTHFHRGSGRFNGIQMTDSHNDTLGMTNITPVLEVNSDCYANVSNIRLTFPRNDLEVLKELGNGEFGKVLMAKALGLSGEGQTTTVAVKTLKDTASLDAKNQLLKEFQVMKLLTTEQEQRNPNIIQLLGACMEADPMYVILEYMPKGDLKTLLRQSRVNKCEIQTSGESAYGNLVAGSKSFTPPQLLTFARDVANGMAFLAEQKCIHRDLAARNVLLNEHLVCKVSDFGLARDVMDVEIYQRLSEIPLPIRWMAYESVVGNVHTIESDVWSFGVLLWEIITLGGRPYPRMNGKEIRQLLKTGYRMPQPKHCSEQLYTVMSSCWEKEAIKRPTFVQLIRLLDELIAGQMGYLTLEDLETILYEDSTAPDHNEKV